MKDLSRKTALITGGGTGIGRATAFALAERGVNIAVNYSSSADSARETADEVRNLGVKAITVAADVSDDDAVHAMVSQIVQEFGAIDILVNNAGKTHFVALDDLEGMRGELWDDIFAVNVKGAFFVTRAAAPQLKRAKGCVVNVASIAGITGRGSSMAYAASKAALLSVTKSFALALAPDVRVNAVAPGIVLTRWVAGRENFVEQQSARAPLQKPAEPTDVAEVICALIDSAGHVTGQTWVVDGGQTL